MVALLEAVNNCLKPTSLGNCLDAPLKSCLPGALAPSPSEAAAAPSGQSPTERRHAEFYAKLRKALDDPLPPNTTSAAQDGSSVELLGSPRRVWACSPSMARTRRSTRSSAASSSSRSRTRILGWSCTRSAATRAACSSASLTGTVWAGTTSPRLAALGVSTSVIEALEAKSSATTEEMLTAAVEHAESLIKTRLPEECNETSGTTACVCLLEERHLTVANVGDSHIVKGALKRVSSGAGAPSASLMSSGGFFKNTGAPSAAVAQVKNPDDVGWVAAWASEDHKPNSPEEQKRIEATGASVKEVVHPKSNEKVYRVQKPGSVGNDGLACARSLGDEELKSWGVVCTPTITTVPIDPQVDRCIAMGSDGIFEFLSDDEVVGICHKYRAGGAAAAARALVLESANRWYRISQIYRDDITALVVFLPLDGESEIGEVGSYAIQPSHFPHHGFPPKWIEATIKILETRLIVEPGDEGSSTLPQDSAETAAPTAAPTAATAFAPSASPEPPPRKMPPPAMMQRCRRCVDLQRTTRRGSRRRGRRARMRRWSRRGCRREREEIFCVCSI